MLKLSRLILMILIIVSSISFIQAQENKYSDIPMSRTADGGFVIGNPDADIKLIEFSDFLCPHCQDYKETIDHYIEEFVSTGQAQFEYRMVPIVNPNLSTYTANLVECADIQSEGSFWLAYDVMFDLMTNSGYSEATVTNFAEQLNLDETALSECAQLATQAQTDAAFAQEIGIIGTPSLAVQYGDSEPALIALPQIGQFDSVVNAIRPATNEVVTIESGRYTGIPTYRSDDGGFIMGSPDAPITIIAFEDFMCPHCQEYQPTVHTFIEKYVATGQAKFEYRFYPLVNPQYSILTAKVAECVALQDLGKFWDAHDLLFEFASANEIDEEVASVVSMLVGVDADAVNACVDNSIQYLVDIQLGQTLQVTGTPGIRARGTDGVPDVIYSGQQALQRGALTIEMLSALTDGSEDFSIGQPEISLLNENFLDDQSLVSGEPCGIPCWQNITPGITTLDEAKAIIEQLESVTIVQESDNNFIFTVNEEDICCQISTQDGETVSTIFLQMTPSIKLGEVIEKHGTPSFVAGEPYTESEAVITLFYPELNTVIYVMVEGENGQLSEESAVFSAIYVEEDLMFTVIESSPLDNWKGYLTYSEYMDGEFDNNP